MWGYSPHTWHRGHPPTGRGDPPPQPVSRGPASACFPGSQACAAPMGQVATGDPQVHEFSSKLRPLWGGLTPPPPGPGWGTRLHLCTGTEDARCEGSTGDWTEGPWDHPCHLTPTPREWRQWLHTQPRLEAPPSRASLLSLLPCVSPGPGSGGQRSVHPPRCPPPAGHPSAGLCRL